MQLAAGRQPVTAIASQIVRNLLIDILLILPIALKTAVSIFSFQFFVLVTGKHTLALPMFYNIVLDPTAELGKILVLVLFITWVIQGFGVIRICIHKVTGSFIAVVF